MATAINNLTHTEGRFLTENEVSEIISIAPNTLRQWRMTGKGPAYVKMGGAIRYSEVALREWIESNTSRPLAAETVNGTSVPAPEVESDIEQARRQVGSVA